MRDFDIRKCLRAKLKAEHGKEPDTRIVEELGLCQGTARVDVAVINGALNGYEIKSERDTLERLPRQQEIFGQCFDSLTLVVGKRLIDRARKELPAWWGIVRAVQGKKAVELVPVQEPGPNPNVDARAVVQLLWRQEAIEAAAEIGLAKALRSKRRQVVWDALVDAMTLDDLRALVRRKIKARGDWRAEMRQAQCGDSSTIPATESDRRANLAWLLSLEFPDRRD